MAAYSLGCLSQEGNRYTIGLDANYFFTIRPKGIGMKDNFNYGFSLLMTERIDKLRIGFGINFSTFNYTRDQNYAYKVVHKVKYLNFPLLIFFNNNSIKLVKISPYAGIIVNKVIRYDQVIYNPDTVTSYKNVEQIPINLGFICRAGVYVSKPIGKHFMLNAAPFADLKFVANGYYSSGYDELPDSFLTFGFRLGFDYLF